MEAVRIFVTGGTFDKEYNELTGALFFKDTYLPEMLAARPSRIDVSVTTLMMIDRPGDEVRTDSRPRIARTARAHAARYG